MGHRYRRHLKVDSGLLDRRVPGLKAIESSQRRRSYCVRATFQPQRVMSQPCHTPKNPYELEKYNGHKSRFHRFDPPLTNRRCLGSRCNAKKVAFKERSCLGRAGRYLLVGQVFKTGDAVDSLTALEFISESIGVKPRRPSAPRATFRSHSG